MSIIVVISMILTVLGSIAIIFEIWFKKNYVGNASVRYLGYNPDHHICQITFDAKTCNPCVITALIHYCNTNRWNNSLDISTGLHIWTIYPKTILQHTYSSYELYIYENLNVWVKVQIN
jgi:hypothetical protein